MRARAGQAPVFSQPKVEDAGAPPRQEGFAHILSTYRQVPQHRPVTGLRGMTISEYLANTVQALSYLMRRGNGDDATRGAAQKKITVHPVPPQPAAVDEAGEAETSPGRARVSEPPAVPRGRVLASHPPAISPDPVQDPVPPSEPVPDARPRPRGQGRQKIDRIVQQAARKYRLPEALINGVIEAESGFRPDAVSPAGACGLMQLMPGTAQDLGVSDPFNAAENVDAGSRYLRRMLNLFDGDLRQALMAYNAGPGTVRRYQGDVPYAETQKYVDRVLRYSGMEGTAV